MFGLMRPRSSCSTKKTDPTYLYHRMHYCGTCKAIGQQFNQGSRLMLNFDTVFLSELLSQLNAENVENWEENLQRVNTCFSMPQGEPLPFSLEYAATASVLLGELKVDDHIKDNQKLSWRLAKRFYSKAFRKAAAQFESWGIDNQAIYAWIETQAEREQSAIGLSSLSDSLDYYAEATAQITAQIFAEGGKRLKKPTDLYQLGYEFGKLMYILDAFEDYEEDVFLNQFNPLAVYWGAARSLNVQQLEQVRAIILSLEGNVTQFMELLPLEALTKQTYQERLSSNLALRLYRARIVPTTFKERLILRWNDAKDFADQVSCQPQSLIRQMNYYMIVLAVFINPQTTDYLPQDGKMEVFKWTAFITATLASIGLAGVVRRNRKAKRKERRQQKRKENRIKRFFKKLANIISRRDSCCSSCCSSCCENCGEACCETICESDNPWFWVLIITALVLTAGLVILILWLAGVII